MKQFYSSFGIILALVIVSSCSNSRLAINKTDKESVASSSGSDEYHKLAQIYEPAEEKIDLDGNIIDKKRTEKEKGSKIKTKNHDGNKGKVLKKAKKSLNGFAQNTIIQRLKLKQAGNGVTSTGNSKASTLSIILIVLLIVLALLLLNALGINLLELLLIAALLIILVLLILFLTDD